MSLISQQRQALSATELEQLINERARFKQRSHNTHMQVHQPQLENSSLTTVGDVPSQIDIVLLGDSMFERFKTTGKNTQISQLHYPKVFNAGVGGDKIENILYRIRLGLFSMLKDKNPKLIVLQLGTNNLHPKRSLHGLELDNYNLLLQSLLVLFPIQTQILVTALFKRTDVDEPSVLQSNIAIKQLVDNVNTQENNRVHWMESPDEIQRHHLADNVHLNQHGYEIWDNKLYLKIQQLLNS